MFANALHKKGDNAKCFSQAEILMLYSMSKNIIPSFQVYHSVSSSNEPDHIDILSRKIRGRMQTLQGLSSPLRDIPSSVFWVGLFQFSARIPTQIHLSHLQQPAFEAARGEITQGKQSGTPLLYLSVCTWPGSHSRMACGTDSCFWQFCDMLSCSIRIAASRSGTDVPPYIWPKISIARWFFPVDSIVYILS